MKSMQGAVLEHVDGRTGTCMSDRPYMGKVCVVLTDITRPTPWREFWGREDVTMESFLKAAGLDQLVKGGG